MRKPLINQILFFAVLCEGNTFTDSYIIHDMNFCLGYIEGEKLAL